MLPNFRLVCVNVQLEVQVWVAWGEAGSLQSRGVTHGDIVSSVSCFKHSFKTGFRNSNFTVKIISLPAVDTTKRQTAIPF